MINTRSNETKDTVVIIPAFNEEKSIALVLNDLPKTRIKEIIVVNNGSTDDTEKIATSHGALVVYEPKRGYGQACLTGLVKAYELDPENIVFLDGDYSDFPEDLSLLLGQLDHGSDLVLGSRMISEESRNALLPQARFGNQLATFLTKLLFGGKKYTDLGPFRAIKTTQLKKLKMSDTNFGWTIEMQVKAIKERLSYTEVSVRYRKRIGVSKITGTLEGTIKAGYKIIYTIFKYRFTNSAKSSRAALSLKK